MKLTPAGSHAELDRYIGYWEPYATSHDALDKDAVIQGEVRIAVEELVRPVRAKRDGTRIDTGKGLQSPRRK